MELLKLVNDIEPHPLDKYPEFKEYVGNKSKQKVLDNVYNIPECPYKYGFESNINNNCWDITCLECWTNKLKNINW